MKTIGIIPARYASTRFPGKPLVKIAGKPMIQRVYEQAKKAIDNVVVATDSQQIFDTIKTFGGEVVMTAETHKSGTERCAEALQKVRLLYNTNFDLIVNIQGDEPFILPEQILQLVKMCENKETAIATLAKRIKEASYLFDPNVVKLVFSSTGRALYFSRSPIPFVRGEESENWLRKGKFYKHMGIYAYRAEVLFQLPNLPVNQLESLESLEQNRWLAHNLYIKVGLTDYESYSIDTPQDLANLEALITKKKIKI